MLLYKVLDQATSREERHLYIFSGDAAGPPSYSDTLCLFPHYFAPVAFAAPTPHTLLKHSSPRNISILTKCKRMLCIQMECPVFWKEISPIDIRHDFSNLFAVHLSEKGRCRGGCGVSGAPVSVSRSALC